jgi:pimeloyl-ACP methyl ester carboxylesterase
VSVRPHDVGRLVEIAGPWQHRYVAANGARFHVAESAPDGDDGSAPLLVLLHGFPEFWWSWRGQLTVLADAGYRAVAMDLRGYGGSDKTPRGYDPVTLAQDVAGVVKALGERSAVLVGHGWGGYVAWATAALHPHQVSGLCAVSAPHPLAMLASLRRGRGSVAARHVLAMQLPMRPERRLADPEGGFVADHLRRWAAPGSAFPDAETAAVFQQAIGIWPSSHCALEYHRWLFRSRFRADGRLFNAVMADPVRQPVCCITGARDPAVPESAMRASRSGVQGDFTELLIGAAGHFPHEERPEEFNRLLGSWLGTL